MWDGTRCAHTQLKVIVEPSVVDGPTSFSAARERLIADVLVYDNHVESARQLKVRGLVYQLASYLSDATGTRNIHLYH